VYLQCWSITKVLLPCYTI